MGWTSSSAMRAIDASPAESFDEASCRALVGDDAFDPEAWSEAKKDASGAVRKEDLLRTFGWPDEIFDRRAGSRADARAVNDAAESAAAGTPHFYELDPETTRRNRRALYVHSPRRESLDVSGADGRPIRFALWRPSESRAPGGPRAVYLLFHGGGWIFGDAAGLNDERLEEMAETLGIVVLVPEYRKAPENPYPAALDDCDAAAAWCEQVLRRRALQMRHRRARDGRRERGRKSVRGDAPPTKSRPRRQSESGSRGSRGSRAARRRPR